MCLMLTATARVQENYFFKLSKYTAEIQTHLAAPGAVLPERAANEVRNWVADGARDFSMSRASVAWGIPLPQDPAHTVYVWFDALAGYLSALLPANEPVTAAALQRAGWPADVQVIGKDILRFHAVYWPGMLRALGLPRPRTTYGHGFLTKDGSKMGKSLGNVLDPFELTCIYGADAVRCAAAGKLLAECTTRMADVGQSSRSGTSRILMRTGSTVYINTTRTATPCQKSACTIATHVACVAAAAAATAAAARARRFFFMREIPFGADGDFSEGRFQAVVNAALANGLGNLVNRCLGLLAKHAGSAFPAAAADAPADDALRQASAAAVLQAAAAYDTLALHQAPAAAQALVERRAALAFLVYHSRV